MAQFPLFPLWTDAYLGDTGHLTTIEHGAYLLILIAMWRAPTTDLPDDDLMLARIAKMAPAKWHKIAPIIRAFCVIENRRLIQRRLKDERENVKQFNVKQSKNAKRRWLKTLTPEVPPHSSGNAKPMPPYPLSLTSSDRLVEQERAVVSPPAKISTGKKGRKPETLWGDAEISEAWITEAANARERAGLSSVDLVAEATRFADFHASREIRRADWKAAWLKWALDSYEKGGNGRDEPRSLAGFVSNISSDKKRKEALALEKWIMAGAKGKAPIDPTITLRREHSSGK